MPSGTKLGIGGSKFQSQTPGPRTWLLTTLLCLSPDSAESCVCSLHKQCPRLPTALPTSETANVSFSNQRRKTSLNAVILCLFFSRLLGKVAVFLELRGSGCILELAEHKSEGLLLTERQLSQGYKPIYICIGVQLCSCVCVRPDLLKGFARMHSE